MTRRPLHVTPKARTAAAAYRARRRRSVLAASLRAMNRLSDYMRAAYEYQLLRPLFESFLDEVFPPPRAPTTVVFLPTPGCGMGKTEARRFLGALKARGLGE